MALTNASGRIPASEGPPPDAEGRIEKIAESYLEQLQSGETPDRHALIAAHPEISRDLSRRLSLVEMLYGARPH